MFESSEDTTKLDQALAKAQGEFGVVIKNARNPHYKSTYATLSSIIEAIVPALSAQGITWSQMPIATDNPKMLRIMTRVASQGQWIRVTAEVPVAKPDVQGWGSSLTYAKRYTLAAFFGLAEADDDGNKGAGKDKASELEKRLERRADWENASGVQKPKALSIHDLAKPSYKREAGNFVIQSANPQLNGKRLAEVDEAQVRTLLEQITKRYESNETIMPPREANFVSNAKLWLEE